MLNIFPVLGLHRRVQGMSWMRADRGRGGGSEYGLGWNYMNSFSFSLTSRLNAQCTLSQGLYKRVEVVPNMVRHQFKSIRNLFQIKPGISWNYKKSLPFLFLPGWVHSVQGLYRRVWGWTGWYEDELDDLWGGGKAVPNMVRHQLNSIRNLLSK